ncbi:MAG TPA: hypothetical protein VFS25_00730 [Chitinophaga sp.]|uniref:hypothetical protein n=1 Tax=Chitinophaga sp. TaxID=1869181 RepID=UPI002DBBB0EC|nr:hypothetical protein [Chitinophaga sp.]HEU4551319.1 hypothetical protein [Chitinophaga sp.]
MEIVKTGIFFLACCALCGSAEAQQASSLQQPLLTGYIAAAGASTSVSWSVAGNSAGTSPNIMSELKWNHLKAAGAFVAVRLQPVRRWFAVVEYSRAGIFSGSATDHDYQEDDRQYPSYAGYFNAGKGHLQSFSSSLGRVIYRSAKSAYQVRAGYTSLQQQQYLLPADRFTPGDLHAYYRCSWQGIFLKVAATRQLWARTSLQPALAYHQLWYRAVADWNLIPSFQHPLSFRHTAQGFALQPSLGISRQLNKSAAVLLELVYDYRVTGHGKEALYLSTGETAVTRLNQAMCSSWTLRLGIPFCIVRFR